LRMCGIWVADQTVNSPWAGTGCTTTPRGLGLPRFDGQGRWLGQAACWMTSLWAAVSNSLGVR
jgi:hypothetical protein